MEQIELDVSLAAVKQELKGVVEEAKKLGSESSKAFQSMMKEAQELAAEQRKLNEELDETSDAIKRTDTATGGFATRVKNAIGNTSIFGKTINEWSSQLGGFISRLGSGEGAIGRFGGAFKVLGNIIKLSPIGLLIGVVAALIGYFTRFQSGIDKVSQVTAGFSAIVNVLIERFLLLGKSIVSFFSGNFTQAADELKASFKGIGDELYNSATAAAALEKRFQELRDATRTASVEAARMNVDLQKSKQIADDATQSFSRRTAAAIKAAEVERKIADQALDIAAEKLAAEQEYFAQNKESGEARDRLAKAVIDLSNAEIDRNSAIAEGESKIRDIRKDAADKARKYAEYAQKERDKLLKDLEKLRVEIEAPGSDERVIAEVQKKYSELIRVAEAGVAKLNEIEKRQGLSEEQIAQRKEFSDIAVKLKEQELGAILDALTELSAKEIEIEEEQRKAKQALKDKDFEAAKKSIERTKELENSKIDITEVEFKNLIATLEAGGAKKEVIAKAQLEFDRRIQGQRLEIELAAQEKLLLVQAEGDEDAIQLIKNKIAKIKAELEGLSTPPPSGDPKDGPFSLGSLLGLDPGDQDDFDKAVAIMKNSLSELAAARVAAAQAAVDAADREVQASHDKVESAEEDLERELALAELGFASDVTRSQQRLEQAKKEEAEAKARQERAIQDQKKAQRAQILLDSAFQVNNLITASTQVFKGFSNIPIIGVGLGIAAVALLIGSFIAAKAKALQAVKAREGIQGRVGKSGIIVGPSHEGGGVPLEVEGGEFTYQDGKRIAVVNKRATADHFGLLQAINNDDRFSMARYLERLTGGVRRNPDVGAVPSGSGSSSSTQFTTQDTTTHRLLEENNRLQRKIIALEENKETVIDMGDHIIVKRKGREQRIEKRKQ